MLQQQKKKCVQSKKKIQNPAYFINFLICSDRHFITIDFIQFTGVSLIDFCYSPCNMSKKYSTRKILALGVEFLI